MSIFTQAPSRRSLLKSTGAAAIGMTFGGALAACSPKAKVGANGEALELNFYNWDTYIGPTTLDDFKKASDGVNVKMDLFASNDELFQKLKAGNPGYDVIVPSNEFVTRMGEAGLLEELDHAKIPNIKNLLPEFTDATFDPGRKYSLPYTWLVLGIGYNKANVKTPPDSWKVLFDSPEYKGRIILLKESADLIRLCAKYLGNSVNGIPDDMLTKIEAMLTKQKPNVVRFHDDDGQDALISGECDLVLEYNGDIAQIMRDEPDKYEFVVPKEGSLLNQDCLCIPKGAPRPDNAHRFINYLLDAEAGKKIADEILYPTPNAAARALMDEAYKNNPVIFPTADQLAKCEYGLFEGAEKSAKYEEMITRVLAS